MKRESRAAALLRAPDEFRLRGGILEHEGATRGVASLFMRLMHSRWLARVYESAWRPIVTRLFSSLGYASEDALIDRYLSATPSVALLDLCCGTARASRRFAHAGATVLGIDCSLGMLGEARRLCQDESLVLVLGDAEASIAQPGAFDAAICFAALHLLPEPEAAVRRVAEALRPGGIFFVWATVEKGVLAISGVRRMMALGGLQPFADDALEEILERAGFAILERSVHGAVELAVARRI